MPSYSTHTDFTEMATLDSLKQALRQKTTTTASSPAQPLSDTQFSAGFDILKQGPGWATYRDFIIPQLSQLVASLCHSRVSVSVLEIGPGSQSVLGHLPHRLRRKIRRYAAFEPRLAFATRLEEWIRSDGSDTKCPLPCLETPPDIQQVPFSLDSNTRSGTDGEKFDIILFCHSMYGLKPKHMFIKQALEMLVERPVGGLVVLFHRDGSLQADLNGLVCHRTASFPTGVVCVADEDTALDCFAPFVNGFTTQDVHIQAEWRKVCRALGRCEESSPGYLFFSSPVVMVAFTRDATTLTELTAQVPSSDGAEKKIKNCEARLHRPASVMRPTEVQHVQECVRWALKHHVSLTVVGGGHSGQCLWPSVVAIDMGAFSQLDIITAGAEETGRGTADPDSGPLIVAGAGCKTGDIVSKAMEAGLTVPLGARPSVGAGLWLQGGIGHLARLHGLSCDAIVGAVVVSVGSGEVLCVGRVPKQHRPTGAVRPDDETDLLWAIRGAGTNFGIVISVTFKACTAPAFLVRNWHLSLSDDLEARSKLGRFDEFAGKLSRNCSADAYLYLDEGKLRLGVTMLECSTSGGTAEAPTPLGTIFGPEDSFKAVDTVGLFGTEMYMYGMHGGHGGGKTSSFKRCIFLKHIGTSSVADVLTKAMETCPSPLCYLHLLQGGGAASDVAVDATAFGCRDWDFACVVTGVWSGDQNQGAEAARAAVQWVYQVAQNLLPLSRGVYGADLGPDPRDALLAARAFGPNLPRLVRLKRSLDPHNVLAQACPLALAVPKAPTGPELIVLVTGACGVGKDYFAEPCIAVLCSNGLTARAVSISDDTKRQYAAATGADLHRLLSDRGYKEQHRPALTAFFQSQVRQRPSLREEHFLHALHGAGDVDVLLITGMRDEAPVAALSHLVPDSRLLELRVTASEATRRARRGVLERGDGDSQDRCQGSDPNGSRSDHSTRALGDDHRPSLICNNDAPGSEAATNLAQRHLLPLFDVDLQRLSDMVRAVPDFPRAGIEFRHVLDIAQQPGGLALCTSLLRAHFTGDWGRVDAVVCCEAGGFVFASALAVQVDSRLVLIRKAGKLPPPTVSAVKSASHISSLSSAPNISGDERIEMGRDVVPRGASVVVVEDVLATGVTLCAVLELLDKVGIGAEHVSVMAVAEFPAHRGRELLRRRGFGKVHVQSVLVCGGH